MDKPLLAERYRLETRLGIGPLSETYRATDIQQNSAVVIKVLEAGLVPTPQAHERLMQTLQPLFDLRQAHIAPLLNGVYAAGRTFLISEFIDGLPLSQALGQRGPIPWKPALYLFRQLAAALDTAYPLAGTHRNLKPGNLLISAQRGAILSDYGLLRALVQNGLLPLERSVHIAGAYHPSEVWLGRPVVAASDQYSLACLLVEALLGQPLFNALEPTAMLQQHLRGASLQRQWPANVPAEIETVLARALSPQATGRFENAAALIAALEALPIPQTPPPAPPQAAQPPAPPSPPPPSPRGTGPLIPHLRRTGALKPPPGEPPAPEPEPVAPEAEIVEEEPIIDDGRSLDRLRMFIPEEPAAAPAAPQPAADKPNDEDTLNQLRHFVDEEFRPEPPPSIESEPTVMLVPAERLQQFAPPPAAKPPPEAPAETSGEETASFERADVLGAVDLQSSPPQTGDIQAEERSNHRRRLRITLLLIIVLTAALGIPIYAYTQNMLPLPISQRIAQIPSAVATRFNPDTPTPEASPTPLPTADLPTQAFAATPAPSLYPAQLAPLTAQNAPTAAALARWGYGAVRAIDWSPSAQIFVIASTSHLIAWNAGTLQPEWQLELKQPVEMVRFSPDSTLLVVSYTGGQIDILEAASGTRRFGLQSEGQWLDFSPDGSRLIAYSLSSLQTWRFPDGAPDNNFTPSQQFQGVVWPAGRSLSILFDGLNSLGLGDPTTGEEKITLGKTSQAGSSALAHSLDGRQLATAYDRKIDLWDLTSNQRRHTLQIDADAAHLTFSADGRYLAVSLQDGEENVSIWETGSGALVTRLKSKVRAAQIAFAPEGRSLLLAAGGQIEIWGLPEGKNRRELPGYQAPITALALSSDGKWLAWSTSDGPAITVRSLPGGETRQELTVETSPGSSADRLAFSPDGKLLAFNRSGVLKLWAGHTWQPVTMPGVSAVTAFAFNPTGDLLATASEDGNLNLWQVAGEQISASRLLSTDAAGVRSLAFNADGRQLASAGSEKTIRLWDVAGGAAAGTLELPQAATVTGLAFAPTGGQLAAALDENKQVLVWDLTTKKVEQTLEGADAPLTFSPDGSLLAVRIGYGDVANVSGGVIVLYKAGSAEPIAWLRGHTFALTGLVYRADGSLIVSAGEDGNILFWGLPTP